MEEKLKMGTREAAGIKEGREWESEKMRKRRREKR